MLFEPESVHDPRLAGRAAPPELWAWTRFFINMLIQMFGDPALLARERVMKRHVHELATSWFRCAEAMLRRLLLIEAAALPAPAPLTPRAARAHPAAEPPFAFETPALWCTSFRCSAPGKKRRAAARTPRKQTKEWEWDFVCRETPKRQRRPARSKPAKPSKPGRRRDRTAFTFPEPEPRHDTRALAYRLEAMMRVWRDPAPYAKRLARRLTAQPKRALYLLYKPPEAIKRWPLEFAPAGPLAERSYARFQKPPDTS